MTTKRAGKKTMTKRKAIARFEEACAILNEIAAAGYELYVAGSGSFHLMSGPSHAPGVSAMALRENSVHSIHVHTMSGGDW